jgi:galactonate dehydratase
MSAASGTGSPIRVIEQSVVPVSNKTAWILVEIRTEDGGFGYGEATAAGSEAAVLAEIGNARSLLVGKPLMGPGEALAALRTAHVSAPRRIVMSALEQACLDLVARRAGLPLAALLGGPARRAVPVYANINRGIPDRSPAGFAARARTVVDEDGYRAVKIAPFDGLRWDRCDAGTATRLLDQGVARIAAVREAIGDDVALHVDCHSRLSPGMARTVLREVETLRLFWLEDPLDDEAFDDRTAQALRLFANDRGTRIAGGEHLSTLAQARAFLARGGVDAILPDLRLTGIRTAMSMLELAVASGVAASLHNPVGPVLDLVSLQVAAALPSFLVLERQVRESPLFDEIRSTSTPLVDGCLELPAGAGIGVVPDRGALTHHAAAEFRPSASFAGVAGAGADA